MVFDYLNPAVSFSAKDLAARIKTEFTEFLEQANQSSDQTGIARDLLASLHRGDLKPEIYREASAETINWYSSAILSAEDFNRVCNCLTATVDNFIRLTLPGLIEGDKKLEFMQSELNEPQLTDEHLQLINNFGVFLRDKYIVDNTESAYEMMCENNMALEKLILCQFGFLLYETQDDTGLPLAKSYEVLLNQVTNSLVRIIESPLIDKAGLAYSRFVDSLTNLIEKRNQLTRLEILELTKELIETSFADHLAAEHEAPQLRILELDSDNPPAIVLRAHNLVFTYPHEKTDLTELLCLEIPKSKGPHLSSKPVGPIRDFATLSEFARDRNVILYDSTGQRVYSGTIDWTNLAGLEGPYYVLKSDQIKCIQDAAIIEAGAYESSDDKLAPEKIELNYLRQLVSSIIYKGQRHSSLSPGSDVRSSELFFTRKELISINTDLAKPASTEDSLWITEQVADMKSCEGNIHAQRTVIWNCCAKLNWIWNYANQNQALIRDSNSRLSFLKKFVVPCFKAIQDTDFIQGSSFDLMDKVNWLPNPDFFNSDLQVNNELGHQFDSRFLFLPMQYNAKHSLSSQAQSKLNQVFQQLGINLDNLDTRYFVMDFDADSSVLVANSLPLVSLDKTLFMGVEGKAYSEALAAYGITKRALEQIKMTQKERDFVAATVEAQLSLELELIFRFKKPEEDSQMKASLTELLVKEFGENKLDQIIEMIRNNDYMSIGDFKEKLQKILGLDDLEYHQFVNQLQRQLNLVAKSILEKIFLT